MNILLTLQDEDLSMLGNFDNLIQNQMQDRGWGLIVERDVLIRDTRYIFRIPSTKEDGGDIDDYMDLVRVRRGGDALGNGLYTNYYIERSFKIRGKDIEGYTVYECLAKYLSIKYKMHKEAMVSVLREINKPRRIIKLGGTYE